MTHYSPEQIARLFDHSGRSNMRGPIDMARARQALCDFIYPPEPIEYPYQETHSMEMRRPYFQGWATAVMPTHRPEGECVHCEKGHCDRTATHRIRINVWGTLCELDVCEGHSRFASDGRSVDGIWCDGPPTTRWEPE